MESVTTVTYEVRDGRALYNSRRLREWVPDIVGLAQLF